MRRASAVAVLALLLLVLPGCASLTGAPQRSDWAFQDTGLQAMAERGLTGRGIRVAVVDTGIELDHPVLAGVRLVAWRDVTDGRPDPYDPEGHGTHVAGLLAGSGTLRGAAPDVELVVAKVFDDDARASDTSVATGIRFAIEQRAQVIGLSLGGDSFPILGTASEDAVREAIARGILVVAAAGNDGPDNADVRSPASVAGAIAVAAVDREGRVGDFSSRGGSGALIGVLGARQAPDQKPELSAPGVKVVGPYRGGKYVESSGTSSAVPFVVGALALMLQANPDVRPRDAGDVGQVKQWLMETAADLPGAQQPHDRATGYGLVRADRLADRAKGGLADGGLLGLPA